MTDDTRAEDGDEQQPGDEEARESRATGGDAPAAASIAEREAVARDESPFDEDEDEGDVGDLTDEVERRRRQGQGRSPHPPQGSEGAAGKIESGEW